MEIRGENDENHEANINYTTDRFADIPVLLFGVAEGGVVQSSWSSAGGWHWGWFCSAGTKLLF